MIWRFILLWLLGVCLTNGVTQTPIAQQQCSSNASGITIWATNGWTYDGLNRVRTQTSKDGVLTTFGLDPLGDVTNRAMPGGLAWAATYFNDGRIASEMETNSGLTARSMSYTYYAAGNSFAGFLDTVTDGRGTIRTLTYDDFQRLSGVTTTGSLAQQQTTTSCQYDPRGSLTQLSQSFASSATGPATVVARRLDGYGQISLETVAVGGAVISDVFEWFDGAGRRSQMIGTPYNYQADGQLIAADGSTFGYANNGLLTGRTNASRKYTVTSRDGRGRSLTSVKFRFSSESIRVHPQFSLPRRTISGCGMRRAGRG